MKALKDRSERAKRIFFDLVIIPYLSGTIILAVGRMLDASDPIVFGLSRLAFLACLASMAILGIQTVRASFDKPSHAPIHPLLIAGLIVPLMLFRLATVSSDFLPTWGEYVKAALAAILLLTYLHFRRKLLRRPLPNTRVIP